MSEENDAELPPWTEPREKRRGRPPGAKNKAKPIAVDVPLETPTPVSPTGRLMPPSSVPFEGYNADPLAIATRQFAILDWMQQALRNEMKAAMQAKGKWISIDDIEKAERLSNGIVRGMDALKKAVGAAEEMKKKLTPAQMLEHSIKTIEGQDMATQRAVIKRLRAHIATLAPQTGLDVHAMGDSRSAASMIDDLENEA